VLGRTSREQTSSRRFISPLSVLYWVGGLVLLVVITRSEWDSRIPFPLLAALMGAYVVGAMLLHMRIARLRPNRKHLCVALILVGVLPVGAWLGDLGAHWGAGLLVVVPLAGLFVWADLRSRKDPPESVSLEKLRGERNFALLTVVGFSVPAGILLLNCLWSLPSAAATVERRVSLLEGAFSRTLLTLVMIILAGGACVHYALVVFKMDLLRAKRSEEQEQSQNGEKG